MLPTVPTDSTFRCRCWRITKNEFTGVIVHRGRRITFRGLEHPALFLRIHLAEKAAWALDFHDAARGKAFADFSKEELEKLIAINDREAKPKSIISSK